MKLQPINNVQLPIFKTTKRQTISPKKNNYGLLVGTVASLGLLGCGCYLIKTSNKKEVLSKLSKTEFINLCKSSNQNNYKASIENLNSCEFMLDLHSHSCHSDGHALVKDIINQANEYANKVYEKTGKKFTLALTDHDSVSGVKEALEIIQTEPAKYKNLNFIPGVELSFAFNSNGMVKNGEILVYNIDPNSKEIEELITKLQKNRYDMFDKVMNKLGKKFFVSEMENYFINRHRETFAYNLHYRIENYAQIKNRIINMAKEQGVSSSRLYSRLMDGYVFRKGKRKVQKPFVTPQSFDKYLKRENIKTNTPVIDDKITEKCAKIFPQIIEGRVVSNTENSFEKIIDTFKDNENVVLAFAHPYFTAKQMVNFKSEFDKLLEYANGKILMSENFHQAYSKSIPINEIEEINNYLLSKNLIPIGGRDNHSGKFLP